VAVTVPFVALTTKGYVPVAVGVPEIEVVEAVDVPMESPVGSVPEATDHVNGPTAVPVAFSVTAYETVVVPFGSDVGVMTSVAPPPQLVVQPGVATVTVVLAVLLPVLGSVEEAVSVAEAVFTICVPEEAFTWAAIWSVAVELALMSPIVQRPVELA
jgi:hypothetical protein